MRSLTDDNLFTAEDMTLFNSTYEIYKYNHVFWSVFFSQLTKYQLSLVAVNLSLGVIYTYQDVKPQKLARGLR